MKNYLLSALAAGVVMIAASSASAERVRGPADAEVLVASAESATDVQVADGASAAGAPDVEAVYDEILKTYGVVPTFMKVYPKHGIAAAWALTRDIEVNENTALSAKTKSLINIAVAAQIPCRYCVWVDSVAAKQLGASQQEIAEAVAQAALTRHWSTVLNGMQIDFEEFKAEFGGE
ncbi:carboxymuconolactone decarboxylase family protein [Martelella sp. FOR1707]